MDRHESSRHEQFVRAWAAYLDGFIFDLWLTLTFARPLSHAEAEAAWIELNHLLRRELGHRVEWFLVSELQPNRGVVYFHSLMGHCQYHDGSKLLPSVVKAWWESRYGRANIDVYDPERGTRYYLAQKLAWDDEHRVSDVLSSRGFRKLALAHGKDS
ncbi:MAG: hypothetical protein ABIL25_00795 [candidate division WOR-3 bacterium]